MTQGQTPRAGRLPDHTGNKRVLPHEGRLDPAPAWPLPGNPTDREAQLWTRAWSRPQALIWEENGQEDLVALYVRKTAEAEKPASTSATVETSRRLADDLLLTVPAMKRAGVVIGRPAAPDADRRRSGVVTPISGHRSAKDRFARGPGFSADFGTTPTSTATAEDPA